MFLNTAWAIMKLLECYSFPREVLSTGWGRTGLNVRYWGVGVTQKCLT